MALKPVLLDSEIADSVESGDPQAVANSVANSNRLLVAIREALDAVGNRPPKVIGPTKVQIVRQAIIGAITAEA